jgi:hypothetical protein
VAVNEHGDVYQWGSGYNDSPHSPELTLKNRNISTVAISESRLFGLTKDGTKVYIFPKSRPNSGPSKAAIEYNPSGSAWRYIGLGGDPTKNDHMTQLPVKEVLRKGEVYV